MNDIILKIRDLYDVLVKANAKAEVVNNHLMSEMARLDGREANLQLKDEDLAKREDEIRKIENLVEIKKNADLLMLEASRARDVLAAEKKRYIEDTEKDRRYITTERDNIKRHYEDIKCKEAEFLEKSKKLDIARATYKDWVIKEIDRKG